jgi:mRNA interferase MazF
MIQGDVVLYTFKSPDKRRPVLVLMRDSLIEKLNAVTIAPITTTIRNVRTEVLLSPAEGLQDECVVNLTGIQTVDKTKLGKTIAHLSPEIMSEVRMAIEVVFGFDRIAENLDDSLEF